MDSFATQALDTDPDQWISLRNLPPDMVVYRYLDDTLQSWSHQFPIPSDDIRKISLQQRLTALIELTSMLQLCLEAVPPKRM